MTDLNHYHGGTANWRDIIRRNTRRTYLVMATYVLIYLAIGLLFDLFLYSERYPQATVGQIFNAIIHLQLFPVVTLITLVVAIISLWVTFAFADQLMLLGTEYRQITPQTAQTPKEQQLYNVVEEMKVAAAMPFMPRVYIIEADYMNAFASGYSPKSAMVAITRGLLDKLDRDELTAVMAHELSHIRHLDIKLTLMASVLSNLVLIVIDVLFFSALFGGRSNDREGNGGRNQLFIVIVILRYLLPLITVLLMLYLSRSREYMADAGAVELMRTNEPMARALLKIQQDHEQNRESYAREYKSTPHENVRRQAYIFDPVQAGIEPIASMSDFLSTHPSIKNRLRALGFIKS